MTSGSIPVGGTPVPVSPASTRFAPAIDVYDLPGSSLDAEDPVWWANTLLMAIETTTITMLVVAYFYLRKNFDLWPPPRVDADPPLLHPVPDLLMGTVNLVLLLGGCVPALLLDLMGRQRLAASHDISNPEHAPHAAARRTGRDAARREPVEPPSTASVLGIAAIVVAIGVATVVVRFYEFPALHFRWDDNAYGSVTWSILGLHLTYLVMSAGEFALIGIWIATKGFTEKRALDLTLAAGSWYWTAAVWALLYLVVYVSPRLP